MITAATALGYGHNNCAVTDRGIVEFNVGYTNLISVWPVGLYMYVYCQTN